MKPKKPLPRYHPSILWAVSVGNRERERPVVRTLFHIGLQMRSSACFSSLIHYFWWCEFCFCFMCVLLSASDRQAASQHKGRGINSSVPLPGVCWSDNSLSFFSLGCITAFPQNLHSLDTEEVLSHVLCEREGMNCVNLRVCFLKEEGLRHVYMGLHKGLFWGNFTFLSLWCSYFTNR